MRRFMRSAMLVALAITTGLVASSNASAAMVKTVVETVSNVQNIFTIMAAAPAQPDAPTAVAGNKSATVTWTAPANNGAAITSYTVTSNPDGRTCIGSGTSCTVTGLTNETPYTFVVTATNALGTSLASSASNEVTPIQTPKLLRTVSLPTLPSANMVFSDDGRYAYWATAAVPPVIVKYDLQTKTELEKITLGATTPAITDVVASGTNAYFFFARGYVQVDLDQFFVVATRLDTIEGWLYPSIDDTGTYLYGINNSTSSNYGTHVRKYEAVTGTLVASYTKNFNDYSFAGTVVSGDLLYVLQVTGTASLSLQVVDANTMLNVGSVIKLTPRVGRSSQVQMDLNADATLIFMRYGDTISKYSIDSAVILNTISMAGTPDVVPGSFAKTTPDYYWANSNSSSRDGLLRSARDGNGDAFQFITYAPKTTLSTSPITKPVKMQVDGTVLRLFTTTGSTAAYREYATTDVASQPLNPVAQFGDEKATVSWTAPSDFGADANVTYRVESSDGQFWCETINLSCEVTGLTNGVSYNFTVVAINSEGAGVSSTSVSATPKRRADAPTDVTAVYGNATATVSWSAPTYNGGASIGSYLVTSNPDGKTCSTSVTRSCSVTGLTNGVEYTFTVQASNVVGLSLPSLSSAAVVPRTVPGAPASLVGTSGNTKATVSWVAPASTGGAAISGYRVVATPGGQSCTTDSSTFTCEFSGLTNGTAYTFAATAQNSEGTSATASTGSVVPSTTPSAPGKPLLVGVSDQSISLTWTSPSSTGGAAITSYLVTSNPGGKTCTSLASTRACTVTGLTNGTAYTFTVVAINVAGSSVDSAASNSGTPRTTPGAPTSVSAVFGNASATVSWVAPTSDGGFAIASYKVVSVADSGKSCTVTAPTTSCTVTGLTNGTSYTFKVTATNGAALVGSASAASNSVVPKTTPGVASALVATAQDSAVKVAWTAPSSNGGATITKYVVTANPGSRTCTTSTTTCAVTSLTNGTSYTFTVVASNEVGDGASSAGVTAVPNVLPAAPTSVQLTAGTSTLTATWQAPSANGGTGLLSYRATATPGGKFCEVAPPALTCDIVDVAAGTSYTVKVVATNATGSGPESAVSNSATPRAKPNTPAAPTSTAGDGQITVSWVAPGDGGSPILSYTVTEVDLPEITCTVIAPALSCVLPELTNGVEYSFKVLAKNAIGDSDYSAASNPVAPIGVPDAPSIAEVRYASGSMTVSWSEPILDGGSPITGYVVTANPGGKTCITDQLECTVTGLTNGTEYTLTVQARNKIGLGAASEPSEPMAPWGAPNAPTGIKAVAGEGEAEVSWTAPTNTDFDTTSYVATSTPGGFECDVTGDTACTVTGLDNGVAYTFTVVATNFSGSSKASAASAAVTPRTSPDAPQQVVPRVVSTGIEVSWIAPEFDGGAKVSFYTATAQPGDLTCVTSNTACVIKGLTLGIDYTITVTASNVVGTSVDSNEIDPVTFGAVPGKPNSVFAIAGPGEMTVSWAAPANTGGSAIEYYVAESTPGGFLCVVEGQSCVVTGLTNGTKYTFTVRAANEFGESDNSIASAALAPVAKPGQPSVVESVFISYDELLVTWTSASASVSAYQVSLLEPNYPYAEIDSTTVSSSTFSHIFEGLNPGDAYRVQVIAYGGGANYIRAASAPARKVGPVLFTEYPTVSGAAMVGNSLTATDGVYAGLPAPTLTRAWFRCNVAQAEMSPLTKDCVAIKGATGDSYKLTASDLGKFIAFGVTATNAYGDTVAYGVVPGKVVSAPILSRPSTFSGTPKSGKTLTSSLGTWVGTPTITYKYQWMRCTATYKAATSKGAKCSAISGATKATYKLAAGDVGRFVRLVVTATNAYGKFEWHTATSGKVSK